MENMPAKQHAHELIDRLPDSEIVTAIRFLEFMLLDPVARAVATARVNAEETDTLSMSERKAIDEADEWLKHNEPIPHEEILAEFGLTNADWEKMGQEPLPEESAPHG